MKYLILCFAALSLSGCETLTGISHDYPRHWPKYLHETSICPDISGFYQNVGEEKYDRGPHHIFRKSLGYRLLGFHTFEPNTNEDRSEAVWIIYSARIVEVVQDESSLTVMVKTHDGVDHQKTWQINEEEATCSSGWLWLPQGSAKGGDGTGGYHNNFKIGIRKAIDGSLVAQEHNYMVGAALWVLPVAGQQVMWFRWLSF